MSNAILQIDASPRGEASLSRQVANYMSVGVNKTQHPSITLTQTRE